jgi:hypothetical protein
MPKYEDVTVQLIGQDGNAFAIIGAVASEIRKVHGSDAASEWITLATASESYDALLCRAMETVHVE